MMAQGVSFSLEKPHGNVEADGTSWSQVEPDRVVSRTLNMTWVLLDAMEDYGLGEDQI